MVLYVITLVPMAEDMRDADPTLLSLFYTDDAAFDRSARWSAAQLKLLMDGSLMGPIEDSLRETLCPALFIGEEVSSDLREILSYSVKHGGLGIPKPSLSVERAYNTSKAASKVLVGSLLGGTDLNYVVHKGCVRRDSVNRQK